MRYVCFLLHLHIICSNRLLSSMKYFEIMTAQVVSIRKCFNFLFALLFVTEYFLKYVYVMLQFIKSLERLCTTVTGKKIKYIYFCIINSISNEVLFIAFQIHLFCCISWYLCTFQEIPVSQYY